MVETGAGAGGDGAVAAANGAGVGTEGKRSIGRWAWLWVLAEAEGASTSARRAFGGHEFDLENGSPVVASGPTFGGSAGGSEARSSTAAGPASERVPLFSPFPKANSQLA